MLDPFAVTFVFTSISIPYIYVYVSTCYVHIDNKPYYNWYTAVFRTILLDVI